MVVVTSKNSPIQDVKHAYVTGFEVEPRTRVAETHKVRQYHRGKTYSSCKSNPCCTNALPPMMAKEWLSKDTLAYRFRVINTNGL